MTKAIAECGVWNAEWRRAEGRGSRAEGRARGQRRSRLGFLSSGLPLQSAIRTLHSALLLALSLLLLPGCGKAMFGPPQTRRPVRNMQPPSPAEFQESGLEFLRAGRPAQAETRLKAALDADPMMGTAHNNLGVVYYQQKRYYDAAWEFQYAIKLMPGKAEPRNNLGMVFDAVGKLDEAAKWYEEAYKLEPETVQIIGNLARLYARTRPDDPRTRELLAEVVLRDQRPDWAAWARERLALRRPPEAPKTGKE